MRIMPVTNQNNFKTKTCFKRLINTGSGIINENDIVSIDSNHLSYLKYINEAVSGGTDTGQARQYLKTLNYSPYGDILKKVNSALGNLDISLGEVQTEETVPVYHYCRTYVFPTPHKKEI